jgi:phosphatidylethanolamine-binding protein (PEBP) family uncharacterized protein
MVFARNISIVLVSTLTLHLLGINLIYRARRFPLKVREKAKCMKDLAVTSPAFENNKSIPSEYTCDRDDVNPPLIIEGIPAETKSLVLIVDDPELL